jgi:antibiotic biosynthesis monooxygenase (ABM) superfamily enzyme
MSDLMEKETPGVARSVIALEVAPGKTTEFAAFEGRMTAACQAFPGFLSIEIARPDAGVQDQWISRISFDSLERLTAWLESDTRHQLLREEASLALKRSEEMLVAAPEPAQEGVTVILHTRPCPGSEAEYERWQSGINAAAATFPGFQQARVFPPRPPSQPDWGIVYAFDTQDNLQRWLDSDARRERLERGQALFEQTSERHLAGGFGNWFVPGEGSPHATFPPGWKQVLTVLLALYPTVMLITLGLVPPLKRVFPQPIWMFISNLVSVAFLQYVAMNVVKRALRFWLLPDLAARDRANLVGLAIVFGAYAFFIIVFMGVVR